MFWRQYLSPLLFPDQGQGNSISISQRHSYYRMYHTMYPLSSLKPCLKVPSRGVRATISANKIKTNTHNTTVSTSGSISSSDIHHDKQSNILGSNIMPTVLLSDDFQQESVSNLLQMLLDLDHGPSEERATVAVATTAQRRRK